MSDEKLIEGDLVYLVKIAKAEVEAEIKEIVNKYKGKFRYAYHFPVNAHWIFVVRSTKKLDKIQLDILDKKQYFNDEERYEGGPLDGFTFKEAHFEVNQTKQGDKR